MLADPALRTANPSCGLQDHTEFSLQSLDIIPDKEDWPLDKPSGVSMAAGDQRLGSMDECAGALFSDVWLENHVDGNEPAEASIHLGFISLPCLSKRYARGAASC